MFSYFFRSQAAAAPAVMQQVANFSRYISKARLKRQPMTTKRAGKGYYKGKGGRKEGRKDSKGHFIVDPERRTELIVPDLTGFKLKAYIQPTVKRNLRDADPTRSANSA